MYFPKRDLNEAMVIFWQFGMRGNIRRYRKKCPEIKLEKNKFSQIWYH